MFNNINWMLNNSKDDKPTTPAKTPANNFYSYTGGTSKVSVSDAFEPFLPAGTYTLPTQAKINAVNQWTAIPDLPWQIAQDNALFTQAVTDAGSGSGGGGGGNWWGGGGGGGGKSKPVKWKEAYTMEGAPSWWRGLLPTEYNATTNYAAIYNAMIPFLSPEDQRTVAMHLNSIYPDAKSFDIYNPEGVEYGKPPIDITSDITEQFTSSDRAKQALQMLDKIAEVSKRDKKKFGAGYQFLRQLLTTMKDFGGGAVGAGNRQSRVQYKQMQSALDPLLSQFKGGSNELKQFAGLAQQLTSPFFTAGGYVPIGKDVAGNYRFGAANKQLFG